MQLETIGDSTNASFMPTTRVTQAVFCMQQQQNNQFPFKQACNIHIPFKTFYVQVAS